MKTLVIAFFASLLLFGCGSPDLDDPKTLDDIIAEAIDEDKLQERGKEGEKLFYAPNKQYHNLFGRLLGDKSILL